ncbi:MAG TPA: TadE family protein [Rhizomicrobium sp.]|nr:TadE family protein [Rhizomicrobium sp.]
MRLRSWRTNQNGATAVEFALTAPAFFVLVVGGIQVGLLGWAQVALQQGTEAAARCASVNKTVCSSATAIKAYASAQSYGLNPPVATFTVSTPACGNMVQANYTPTFMSTFVMSGITLTASSCFPT